jgi:hypothetical protein
MVPIRQIMGSKTYFPGVCKHLIRCMNIRGSPTTFPQLIIKESGQLRIACFTVSSRHEAEEQRRGTHSEGVTNTVVVQSSPRLAGSKGAFRGVMDCES